MVGQTLSRPTRRPQPPPALPFSHPLYLQDQFPIPRVAAQPIARVQVLQAEAVPPALVRSHQTDGRLARPRFGQQVSQPPGEDRDGTAATVLEYQQVEIRPGDLRLQAQQTNRRVQDEPLPRRPCASARPADLEGAGRALHGHTWNYKAATVQSPRPLHREDHQSYEWKFW